MRISDWSSDVCSSDLYLGSNVSYNVKKMVENGYLIQERSPHDRRSFHVRAAAKGIDVYRNLSTLFDQHAGQLNDIQLRSEEHTSELQSLMRISSAVFCLKKKTTLQETNNI